MKCRSVILILFLFSSLFAHGRVGLADWSSETPGGNSINNFWDQTIVLKNGSSIDRLETWYFYHDHIIGELKTVDTLPDLARYFVLNETTLRVDTFKTQQEYSEFISSQDLEPTFWTRRYDGNWVFFDEQLLLSMIFVPFISIPIIVLFLFALVRAIRKEKFSFRKPFTLIVTGCVVLLVVRYLLDLFPQSI